MTTRMQHRLIAVVLAAVIIGVPALVASRAGTLGAFMAGAGLAAVVAVGVAPGAGRIAVRLRAAVPQRPAAGAPVDPPPAADPRADTAEPEHGGSAPAHEWLICATCGDTIAGTAAAAGWARMASVALDDAGHLPATGFRLRCRLCKVGALAVAVRLPPDGDTLTALALKHYRAALQRQEHGG